MSEAPPFTVPGSVEGTFWSPLETISPSMLQEEARQAALREGMLSPLSLLELEQQAEVERQEMARPRMLSPLPLTAGPEMEPEFFDMPVLPTGTSERVIAWIQRPPGAGEEEEAAATLETEGKSPSSPPTFMASPAARPFGTITPREYQEVATRVRSFPKLCEYEAPGEHKRHQTVAVSGRQGVVFLQCPTPDTIYKRSTMSQIAKIHAYREPADLKLFENACRVHFAVNEVALPNLVRTLGCWYDAEPEESNPANTAVNIIQEFVPHDINLEQFLNETDLDELASSFEQQAEVFAIVVQLVGTILMLHERRLYHNDVHGQNVLLTPWPDTMESIEYTIGSHRIRVSDNHSRYLMKLIDYGFMTENVPLGPNWRPLRIDPRTSFPWTDLCHTLAIFEPVSGAIAYMRQLIDSICIVSGFATRSGVSPVPNASGQTFAAFADVLKRMADTYLLPGTPTGLEQTLSP